MLRDHGASVAITAEQIPARPQGLPRLAPPRVGAIPTPRLSARTIPFALGAGYALAAFAFVLVELAQPEPGNGFSGIRFSNAVRSKGTRAIVELFRDHLAWLPRPWAGGALSPVAYVVGLTLSLCAMIALQVVAVVLCRRTRSTSVGFWALGPVIASVVFLLYPPTSTDIYAYASFGWVAEQGQNPYIVAPNTLDGDPYATFNDWTHIQTPYGPIWTGISRGVVHAAGGEPFATAIGFKLVAMVGAFGVAGLTYVLARRFSGDRHLATMAFVLVAWSPILLVESAATVHLDSVMMLLALLGLVAATGERRRSHRLGLALLAASALVKPVTLPLIGIAVLTRLAKRAPLRVALRQMAGDAVFSLALMGAAFLPFVATGLPRATASNLYELYVAKPLKSNPIWVVGVWKIGWPLRFNRLPSEDLTLLARWATIGVTAAVVALLALALRRRRVAGSCAGATEASSLLRFYVWAWAGVLATFSLLPVNAHPWYAIWPLVPLALLWVSNGRATRARAPVWLVGLQACVVLSFLVYHTLPR